MRLRLRPEASQRWRGRDSSEKPSVDGQITVRHDLHRELLVGASESGGAKFAAPVRVRQESAKRGGESIEIARRDEQTLAAVDNCFRYSGCRRGNYGLARNHGLQERHGQSLPQGWHDEDVRQRLQVDNVVAS